MIALEPTAPDEVLAAVRAPFLERDAKPIDTSVMQPLALLLDLSGEAMHSRLFVVQADGIDEACLRPDFTMPVALAHIGSGAPPGAYRYEGKAFLVAPPGSGRSEEFLQIGLELLGETGAKSADAQLLILCWRAAMAGGRKDLHIELGDVSLFSALIDGLGLAPSLAARLKRAFLRPRSLRAELERARAPARAPRAGDELAARLAQLPELEAVALLEDHWAATGVEPVGGRTATEIVRRLGERALASAAAPLTEAQADLISRFLAISDEPAAALASAEALAMTASVDLSGQFADWRARLDMMAQAGLPSGAMRLSPAFGRSFGYYDGFLFEVRSAALGPDQPVAAGGRYDSLLPRLAAQLGKTATGGGAAGCIVRPWRAWSGGQA